MWKLSKIEITYPSPNIKNNKSSNNVTKYYALGGLYFSYGNYQLQFSFDLDNDKNFSLVDFSDKKNPNIIEDTSFDKLEEILSKHDLPNFNPIIYDQEINYLIYENDDDNNYNMETNIDLIKSGDYGYPVVYESKYSLNEYEYSSDLSLKQQLENLILNNINSNLKKYICT
jgi:hypothetical protein